MTSTAEMDQLLEALRDVDEAKDDAERSRALQSLAFAMAAPKLPTRLTSIEAWMMAPVFVVALFGLLWVFSSDIARLGNDSPGRLLITIACFAGAIAVTAFVRQYILNKRGFRYYRKARTGRDTFW